MSVERATDEVKERFFKMFQLTERDDMTTNRKLSEANIRENDQLLRKADILQSEAYRFNEKYQQYVQQTEVKNKILFCADASMNEIVELKFLTEALKEQQTFALEEQIILESADNDLEKIAKSVAEARFILTPVNIPLFAGLSMRDETKIILLNDRGFTWLYNGLAKDRLLKGNRKLQQIRNQMPISVLEVPADAQLESYRRMYNIGTFTDDSLRGSCYTDIYFDQKYQERAKKKLFSLFPEAKGKKVICYVPLFRFRNRDSNYMEFLNMPILKENLSGEYVVIMSLEKLPLKVTNIVNIPGFSKNLTGKMSSREQMLAADVVVGDYRDEIFEAPLMHKPIFLTTRDKNEICKRDAFYEYEEVTCGKEIGSEWDLVRELRNLESFDYSRGEVFCKKYLTDCDGSSAERILEYINRCLAVESCM